MNSKKCPSCGKWSEWNNSVDDICQHCGALLSPVEYAEKGAVRDREKEEKEWFNVVFIKVNPEDPFLLKGIKYIARSFQMVFVAIVSFIIWLVTIATG